MPKTPAQLSAYRAVAQALTAGRLPPVETLACASCGRPAQAYHHHRGYARAHWLEVAPLCDHCHARAHRAALVANVTRARRAYQDQCAASRTPLSVTSARHAPVTRPSRSRVRLG